MNDSLRPMRPKWHFEANHADYLLKDSEFFARREMEFKRQKCIMPKEVTVSLTALKVSYLVIMKIVKSKISHTIAES